MLTLQKATIIAFILITVVSVSLVSYSTYLLFGAYNVGRLLNVSVSKIEITHSNSSEVSIEIYFLFDNPTESSLQLVYFAADVYLNNQHLTVRYNLPERQAYSNPVTLLPSSKVETPPIKIENVPNEKVPAEPSSRNWFVLIYFLVFNVPLIERGTYTRGLSYNEVGS